MAFIVMAVPPERESSGPVQVPCWLPAMLRHQFSFKRLEVCMGQERPDMAQLLDVMPLVAPHAGALPILNWETHLVRGALIWARHYLLAQAYFCVSTAPRSFKKRTTALQLPWWSLPHAFWERH